MFDQKIKQRLEQKRNQLNALRPLPASAVKKLREQFELEMTYNSNGIEGNSLTLRETFLVLSEGVTIKGKPLKDHLEAKDHQAALAYLSEYVEHGRQISISERTIRQLHQLILQSVDPEWAGVYRTGPVMITGTKHKPPEAFDVPHQVHEMIVWFKKNEKRLHPVELAAIIHHRFVAIHPFFDGNGRTARLLMNILLMRAGFPLTIILKNDRRTYYRVLALADKGKSDQLIRFIAQSTERSLDLYLKALTPSTRHQEKFLTLVQLSKKTNFSPKYLNLLLRSGKLEGHKEGRNWVSTPSAVEQYLAGRERKRSRP